MLSPLSSSSITSITSDSDGNPILSYIDPSTGHTLSRSFPAVIVATTTRSMQMIGLTSSTADHGGSILEPVVKVAIRNVHHMDSSKMFIRTQTKFWKVDPTIPQNIQMDELPRGVYSYALYYQFLSVLDPAHDRGVYLAGDSVSWSGGWIEGALQTGINAACAAAKRIGASVRPHSPLTQNLHRYNYGSIAR